MNEPVGFPSFPLVSVTAVGETVSVPLAGVGDGEGDGDGDGDGFGDGLGEGLGDADVCEGVGDGW